MATKITNDQIIEMNELYLEIKTYSGVAKIIGVSPSTVKKYIIPNFTSQKNIQIVKFTDTLPEFNSEWFRSKNWKEILELENDEYEEIKELWKELTI